MKFITRIKAFLASMLHIHQANDQIQQPSTALLNGEVLWLGDYLVDESCKGYWRPMVYERSGLLFPATHFGSLDGAEEVTSYAPVLELDEAKVIAKSFMPF